MCIGGSISPFSEDRVNLLGESEQREYQSEKRITVTWLAFPICLRGGGDRSPTSERCAVFPMARDKRNLNCPRLCGSSDSDRGLRRGAGVGAGLYRGDLSFGNHVGINPLFASSSCKYERPGASPKRSHDGECTAVPSKCPAPALALALVREQPFPWPRGSAATP